MDPEAPLRALFLFLAGCTVHGVLDDSGSDTGQDTDTGSDTGPDTSIQGSERLGVRGEATIDVQAGTWTGETTAYDEIVGNGPTQTLCALRFASVGVPAEVTCPSCTFAFAVSHTEATGATGSDCDGIWPEGHPARNPAFWDGVLGYDPTGPALMVWVDAWTDSYGTYHPAGWEAVPSEERPDGGATWNAETGAFTFDRPLASF